MFTRTLLATCLALLAGALAAPQPAAAQETVTEKVLQNQDNVGGACHPSDLSDGGCCGAPGRRGCSTLPTCTSLPSGNKLRIDPEDGSVVCEGHAPSCNPALAAALTAASPKTGPLDVTFYLTSDLHFFRNAWRLPDQMRHARMMNNFAGYNQFWPSGSGIPSQPIAAPMGVVIAGDIADFSDEGELGAYRMVYEQGTTPDSINYLVFPGLGNHDIGVSDVRNQQRMFDYVGWTMGGCGVNLDPVSHSYSWNWGKLHVIQLNEFGGFISPLPSGSRLPPVVGSNLPWLINDLASLGDSELPVIIIQHVGCDSFSMGTTEGQTPLPVTTCEDGDPSPGSQSKDGPWWTAAQRQAFLAAIKPYNIVGLFTGHNHWPAVERVYQLKDSNGNYALRLDNYINGAGGYDSSTFDDPVGMGHGEFYVVHVTDSYLDVAEIQWKDPDDPQTDEQRQTRSNEANEIGPIDPANVAPGFIFEQPGCRKRIGDRFINVPPSFYSLSSAGGTLVSVHNNGSQPIPGPIALRISGATTRAISFVDTCVAAGTATAFSANDRAYVLLNLSIDQSLAPGASMTVDAGIPFNASIMDLAVLTPIHGSSMPNGISITVDPKVAPAGGSVIVYGPPNTLYSLQATGEQGLGWLVAGATSGIFDVFGRATLSYSINMTPLGNVSEGSLGATLQLNTNAVDAQGNQLALGVPVSIHFKLLDSLTLSASSGFNQPGQKATFTAILNWPTRFVDPSTGDAQNPTGEIDLYEITGGARTLLSRAFMSTPDGCQPYPSNNSMQSAVFGDYNAANYCASVQPTTSSPWVFSLPAGSHQLIASFPGDSFYLPVDSAPIVYRVGQPLSSLNVFFGGGQTTAVGAPFSFGLIAKVLDVNSQPAAGVTVSFVFPSSGPSATLNGSTVWSGYSDSNGLVTTPIPVGVAGPGSYTGVAQVTESGSPSFTSPFTMINQAPVPGPPVITAAVVLKGAAVSPATDRQWGISLTNKGGTATTVELTGLQFTVEAGQPCTPVIDTPLPVSAPVLLGPGAAGGVGVNINFGSCSSTTRFTATISVSANNGTYTNSSVIAHQFQ